MPYKRLTFKELVDLETIEIAKEILATRLAEENLPLPADNSIAPHVEMLLKLQPEIATLAQQRVENRLDAYSKALRAIGLNDAPIKTTVDI